MALTSARLSGDPRLASAANNQPSMKQGEAKSRGVEILQLALSDLGMKMPRSIKRPGVADGIFGRETADAVKAFQRANGLTPDGVAGRMTLSRLDDILNAKSAASRAAFMAQLQMQGPLGHFSTD
jgi:peptidoglycan hydrolase-like protein with peptidoglycan-binding domain